MRDLAAEYGKPVLLINGDFHEFIIDSPFSVSQGETGYQSTTISPGCRSMAHQNWRL